MENKPCGCSGSVAKGFERTRYAVVSDVLLANTPNLIPVTDKFDKLEDAHAAVTPGYYVVAIVETV